MIPPLPCSGWRWAICCTGQSLPKPCLRPGMGARVVTSIQALDFPAVMGFAVVVSLAYVFVNLVVDLLYLWIDPRIGRGGAE